MHHFPQKRHTQMEASELGESLQMGKQKQGRHFRRSPHVDTQPNWTRVQTRRVRAYGKTQRAQTAYGRGEQQPRQFVPSDVHSACVACVATTPFESQSKPGIRMAYPEPLKELRRRISAAICGWDHPLLTFTYRVLIVAHFGTSPCTSTHVRHGGTSREKMARILRYRDLWSSPFGSSPFGVAKNGGAQRNLVDVGRGANRNLNLSSSVGDVPLNYKQQRKNCVPTTPTGSAARATLPTDLRAWTSGRNSCPWRRAFPGREIPSKGCPRQGKKGGSQKKSKQNTSNMPTRVK